MNVLGDNRESFARTIDPLNDNRGCNLIGGFKLSLHKLKGSCVTLKSKGVVRISAIVL